MGIRDKVNAIIAADKALGTIDGYKGIIQKYVRLARAIQSTKWRNVTTETITDEIIEEIERLVNDNSCESAVNYLVGIAINKSLPTSWVVGRFSDDVIDKLVSKSNIARFAACPVLKAIADPLIETGKKALDNVDEAWGPGRQNRLRAEEARAL
jgi:hypothetical protein